MEIRVYYEDTDCGGVVYYANYLKYFERARTEFIREKGGCLTDYMEDGITFIVVRAEVDYKSPAKYDDILDITTEVSRVRGATFDLTYTVLRRADGKLIASGTTKMGCVNKEGKPTRIPDGMLNILRG